ncbi:MAG: DUF721 domain-containing protein [Saprospiraceae bacterium]|nr:DUF721 domain-containing protein [Saprospiraceae bacterium]
MKFDINKEHNKLSYRKSNDSTIGNILIPYLKAYGLIEKYHASRAKQIWYDTMGPKISSYTKNIYVKKRKLYITISSSSLRQEISFSKDKIKKFINDEIGEEFLKGVIIW